MCFSHSAEGALFAATHAAAERLQKQPDVDWVDEFVSKRQEFRSLAIYAFTKRNLLVSLGYKLEEIKRVEIVGYRYDVFGYHEALIYIGIRVTDDKDRVTYITSLYNLKWEDKDWKLRPSVTDDPTETRIVPNLDGYISWR